MGDDFYHEPVLINEAIGLLTANKSAAKAKVYVDCTLGGGGYTGRILKETEEDFIVIAIDRDSNAIDYSKNLLQKYQSRLLFVRDNFADISGIIKSSLKNEDAMVSGIVIDLGLSSYQLNFEEGFSYQKDTELDMRAGKDTEITAKDILNEYTQEELIELFRKYGELKYNKQISRDIVEQRKLKKFETTFDLVEVLKKKIPPRYLNKDLSKVFQALRIEVNSEIENLNSVLEGSAKCLEGGGRIAVLSYHSIEDRIVKNFFRSSENLKIITKKPVEPTDVEIAGNIRSRSAKLRAAEKIQ
ncbi:MAG: 16S rRNA (cytosine(1402)-N(4))-methyltransferase RsmH [Ignavibacteria bacterium]